MNAYVIKAVEAFVIKSFLVLTFVAICVISVIFLLTLTGCGNGARLIDITTVPALA